MVRHVRAYIKELAPVRVLSQESGQESSSTSIGRDLRLLSMVAALWSTGCTLTDRVQAKQHLQAEADLETHKALMLFPTGQQLMEAALTAITARTQDDIHVIRLDKAMAQLGHDDIASMKDNESTQLELVQLSPAWDVLFTHNGLLQPVVPDLAFLKANASCTFLEQEAKRITELELALTKLSHHAHQAIQPYVCNAAVKAFARYLAYFGNTQNEATCFGQTTWCKRCAEQVDIGPARCCNHFCRGNAYRARSHIGSYHGCQPECNQNVESIAGCVH